MKALQQKTASLFILRKYIIKFINMDETLKTDSSGLNGETDPLKLSSKSESPEKNLKSQSKDKTLTDNVENGDVDISSKEINDKDNSDSKSDNCDKSIGESTPKKTTDAKAKSVEDKNSNGESENTEDKDKSVEEKKRKDSSNNSPSKGSPSKSSGCEEGNQKDDTTENAEEKDDTTEDSEEKDTENSEDSEVIEDEKDIADKNEEQKCEKTNEEEESVKDKLLDVSEEQEGQIDSPKKDSKTLFSESESEIQKEISKSILCTACSKQIYNINRNEVFAHPVLGVTLCKKCSKFYGKGDFKKDEEGMDEYCRWCANGGELLLCDKCTNGFCKACVRRNLGRGALKEITSQDEWSCYVCSLEPLMNTRALHRAIVESIREKGPDSKSLSKNKETPTKNLSHARGSKKKAESPASDMTHSEDVKGLLILFQKELQKIEKKNSKDKVSEVKFQRRLVRLIDLMQENFKRVKNEIEEEINDCDDKGGSTSEESESLQDKINKLSERVKSGTKKRGLEQLVDEEVDEVVPPNKKQKTDDENSSKVMKSSGRKKRTPAKKYVTKSRKKDVDDDDEDDDAPESNKEEEEEEESPKISEKPKRLRVRSDLFAASGAKGKSKGKNVKGTGKKSIVDDENSDIECLPDLEAKDSDDSEEDTGKRRSGRRAQTPKTSKKVDTNSAKGAKRTSPKDRSKKKSEAAEACIDLCSDSETESPAKKRKSVKRKPETQSKQTRSRRK
ncbi:Transcriptional regulator ATRX [Armadillidium vulgare]|nr:Transcriptional regulator ATRX [Armadillidium vulgare]